MMRGVSDYSSLLSSRDLARASSFEITDVKAGKIQIQERGTKFFGKTICWVKDQFHLHLKKRVLSDSQSAVYKSVLADIEADKSITGKTKQREVSRLETLERSGVPLRVRYLRVLARRLDSSNTGVILGNGHLDVVRDTTSQESQFSISFREVSMQDIGDNISENYGDGDVFAFSVNQALHEKGVASVAKSRSDGLSEEFRDRVITKANHVRMESPGGGWAIRQLDLDNICKETFAELCKDRAEMSADAPQVYDIITGQALRGIENFGIRVDVALGQQGKKFKNPPSGEDLIAIQDNWKAKVREEAGKQVSGTPLSATIADDQLSEVCRDFILAHPEQVEPQDVPEA